MRYPEAVSLLEEFGITVVHPSAVPGVGQTRAIGTVERIRRRHGSPHARFVIMTLADSENNRNALQESTLWATSDLARFADRAYPALMTNRLSDWFKFWDGTPLAVLNDWCLDLHGEAPRRFALFGMLYERFLREFGTIANQGDLLDDRGIEK